MTSTVVGLLRTARQVQVFEAEALHALRTRGVDRSPPTHTAPSAEGFLTAVRAGLGCGRGPSCPGVGPRQPWDRAAEDRHPSDAAHHRPENPTPGTAEMVGLLVRAFATDVNDRATDGGMPAPQDMFAGHDIPLPERLVDDPNGDPHPRMKPVVFYAVEEVGAIAEKAGVPALVFNHFVPGSWPLEKWQAAQQGYSGRLIVGTDLDEIDL